MHLMPPKPLADLLNEYAPINDTARRLVDAALAEAERRGQAVDATHVMFAVLLNPWPIQTVHDSPAIRKLLTNPPAMDELRGALRALVNAQLGNIPHRSHPSGPIYGANTNAPTCTDTLQRCFSLARGRWPGVPINDSILVWAILTDNNSARNAVVGILDDLPEPTFDEIVADLERRVGRAAPSHHSLSNPGIDHSRWMPIKQQPHPTFHHAVRHVELMYTIADKINAIKARQHRQFVLVSGQNGSPLHHVPQILADAIGQDAIHFSDMTSVWWADVVDYLKWADPPPITPGAELLLQEGIDHVSAQNGILVLDHLEKLGGALQLTQMPLQQHLLGQLRSAPGAVIVALYEMHGGDAPDSALGALGFDEEEALLVSIDPFTVEHALSSLRTNFVPEWQERGFIFDGDITNATGGPYHDLLVLREGARMFGKSMAMPYLLVDVSELLLTRRDVPEAIRAWAFTAEDRVTKLLTQKHSAHTAAVLQHYNPLLTEALQQVQPLKVSPAMDKHGAHFVVARRHLTAAFLGSDASRFAYPDSL